jgi:tetratricopeptide (TPR) repeat protein
MKADAQQRTPTRHSIPAAVYVFVAVLLLRLIVLARLTASPLLLPSVGDAFFYHEWAQRIANGQWTDHHAFYGLPFYAYWLAGIYKLFGYTTFVPALLQCCADAATAMLLFKIAAQLFPGPNIVVGFGKDDRFVAKLLARRGELIGIASAGIWALFVAAQSYSVMLMPTVGVVLVFWWIVWQIVKRQTAPPLRTVLLWGILIGLAATAGTTILFVIPLLLAACLFKWSPVTATSRLSASAVLPPVMLIIGVLCGTAPCWIHNYFVARDPVFLSAHGGVNVWIGNNPSADGYPNFPELRAGQAAMLEDSIDVAEAAAGRPLKRAEISAYWVAKARRYIHDYPAAWVKLLGSKLVNFWNAYQYDDLGVITTLRERGVVLPGIRYGLLAALAIPAMILLPLRNRQSLWIVMAIVLVMLALMPMFITERYRLMAAPGLALLAVAGIWILWESCAFGDRKYVISYCSLLIVAVTAVSCPRTNAALWALDAYNSGRQALDSQDFTLAERKLTLAYAYVPRHPEINLALGNLRLAQGNYSLAEWFYDQTLRINPQHKAALNNLAVVALETNRWPDAETALHKALMVDPTNGKTHFLMARAKLQAGDYEAAASEIKQALATSPSQPEFLALRDEIGKALARPLNGR